MRAGVDICASNKVDSKESEREKRAEEAKPASKDKMEIEEAVEGDKNRPLQSKTIKTVRKIMITVG